MLSESSEFNQTQETRGREHQESVNIHLRTAAIQLSFILKLILTQPADRTVAAAFDLLIRIHSTNIKLEMKMDKNCTLKINQRKICMKNLKHIKQKIEKKMFVHFMSQLLCRRVNRQLINSPCILEKVSE